MSDQPSKSEEQHRIDTLQEMANTEHQLRMARTQYESAKWEIVRASEALLEWQNQWSRERSAVFACYPDAMPVDSVVEDARATMDRFLAQRPSALTPTPDFEAEKAVAREQLERELEIEPVPSDELDIALETPRTWREYERSLLSSYDYTPAEHISILTGDPAIEPGSGLHGENPVVIKPYRVTRDLNYEKTVEFFVTEEEATARYNDLLGQPHHGVWLSVLRDGDWLSVAALDEAPALNEQMQDEREIHALPMTFDDEPPTEGYAPVTNPEADAIARAHDYYSAEKIAERNRFNPFTMFRREPEGV